MKAIISPAKLQAVNKAEFQMKSTKEKYALDSE
jgi:hypothetical protein